MPEPEIDYGFREQIALRKLGNPEGFQFFAWEFMEPDATLLTGCVVTRTYSKGPRKGRPAYDGERRKVVVTDGEIAAEKRAYESAAGSCAECRAKGRVWAGWNHETGHKYVTCRRCAGSGAAPEAQTA